MGKLILHGGNIENDLELKNSEVTHMRLVLAWMRCEYMLDEHMQAGYAQGTKDCVEGGYITEDQGREHLAHQEEKIKNVPKYVRHGVKMLTKMLREHEKRSGIVDGEIIKQDRLPSPNISN